MTKEELLCSILNIEIQVGEVKLKLEDIINKHTIRGIENDIAKFELLTIDEATAEA